MTMKITMQSIHFDASDRLEAFAQQKVGKLEQYFEGIIKADLVMRFEKPEAIESKIAEISLDIPGQTLFAKKQSKTFEESIDLACEALRKQLVKHKEKIKAK